MPSEHDSSRPEVTFVFPCLNEQGTLGSCIAGARASLETLGVPFEIIVADNGSTDRSREIATAAGCRVVPVPVRGYGAALKAGIEAAESPYVIFADSDSTYLYEHAAPLYKAASEARADMAIASRMIGEIEPGAMPPLHRHLGTPVLTALINFLFRGRLTDCNSGFRCVNKESYARWDIRSDGMEFASELLIKSLKARSVVVEIPSGLRRGPPDRVAHLRTWRDGMRHLLFILSEKPSMFEKSGLLLAIVPTLLQALALVTGPMAVGPFNIFDLHSQALLLLAAVLGTQIYVFGCSLYLRSPDKPLSMTRRLIEMSEGTLFFLLLAVMVACFLVGGGLVWVWARSGFAGLNHARDLLAIVHFLGVSAMAAIGQLSIHTLKKAR